MKWNKQIIVSSFALALAGHFTTLVAQGPADGQSSVGKPPAEYAPRVGLIGGTIDKQLIEDARPMVDKAPEGLFITAPYINSMIVMNVRVYNDQGEQVLYVRSFGETVDLLAADLPNGDYTYQAVTVFELDQPIGQGADYRDEADSYSNGKFTIKGNAIVQPEISDMDESVSFLDSIKEKAMMVVAYSVSALVSDANAANLFADSANPTVYYDDTTSSSNTDFLTRASAVADNSSGDWILYDSVGYGSPFTPVITINTVENSAIQDSINIASNGDITWGNSAMYLDRSTQELALGWSLTPVDFSISDSTPAILLHDSSDTSEAEWQLSNGIVRFWARPTDISAWDDPIMFDVNAPSSSFVIKADGDVEFAGGTAAILSSSSEPQLIIGSVTPKYTSVINLELQDDVPYLLFTDTDSNKSGGFFVGGDKFVMEGDSGFQDIMSLDLDAPGGSLVMDLSGNMGLGTFTPAASLNVTRSDGTTQVLVNETGATATRTLMLLKNPGRTHFKIENTDFGSEWVFTNTGPAFFISLQGTGGPEFKIQNNGNAVLAGTLTQNSDVNAKTAFMDIDSYEILDLVSELPVSKWEYKDARGEAHIGPMAQDFYAAFGLGGTETGISSIDTGGVALAAIKALNEENQSLKEQNASMQEQIASTQEQNAELLESVEELQRQQAGIQVMMATLIEAQQASPVLTKTAMN